MAVPTDSELLDSYRSAMGALARGQSYTLNGRTLTRQDLKQVRETIEWLEERIQAASGDGSSGGMVLARFNRES